MTTQQETLNVREVTPATRRVRLPGPKTLLARTCQRLEKLIQSETLKESKLADCVLKQAEIALALYKEKVSAQRRRLIEENKQLADEVAKLKATAADDDPAVRATLEYMRAD